MLILLCASAKATQGEVRETRKGMGDWPVMDARGAQDRQAGSHTFQTNPSLHPHLPVGDSECLELFVWRAGNRPCCSGKEKLLILSLS